MIEKPSLCANPVSSKNSGGGCYYHPNWIPAHPQYISIGDNVTVCAEVKFYEHDLCHRIWNSDPAYQGPKIRYYTGEIVVGDNTLIGARSSILYNVHIGHNVLIAAGSVVTKDVPDYAIVGGNPARIIGDTRDLYRKRLQYSGYNPEEVLKADE